MYSMYFGLFVPFVLFSWWISCPLISSCRVLFCHFSFSFKIFFLKMKQLEERSKDEIFL